VGFVLVLIAFPFVVAGLVIFAVACGLFELAMNSLVSPPAPDSDEWIPSHKNAEHTSAPARDEDFSRPQVAALHAVAENPLPPPKTRSEEILREFAAIPEALRRRAETHHMPVFEAIQWHARGRLSTRLEYLDGQNALNSAHLAGQWNSLAVPDLAGSEPHSPTDADATHDYPDAIRENGRWGSHPSHDDYSDEGIP